MLKLIWIFGVAVLLSMPLLSQSGVVTPVHSMAKQATTAIAAGLQLPNIPVRIPKLQLPRSLGRGLKVLLSFLWGKLQWKSESKNLQLTSVIVSLK